MCIWFVDSDVWCDMYLWMLYYDVLLYTRMRHPSIRKRIFKIAPIRSLCFYRTNQQDVVFYIRARCFFCIRWPGLSSITHISFRLTSVFSSFHIVSLCLLTLFIFLLCCVDNAFVLWLHTLSVTQSIAQHALRHQQQASSGASELKSYSYNADVYNVYYISVWNIITHTRQMVWDEML